MSRRIVVGFSRPKGGFKPFSWAIRLFEGTPYSHVYIRMHSESLGVDLIYQASGSQVNFMGVDNFTANALVLYEFELFINDDQYKRFMRWAVINSGAPYSLKQPLGILLVTLFNLKVNPFANGRFAWVCSEIVGFFFESFFGLKIDERQLETIGPRGIFEICDKFAKPIEVGK